MNSRILLSTTPTAHARVDHAGGIIRGVAVITEGPARGHGVDVDSETLRQVRTCVAAYKSGLKVKMTHQGDAGDIVGVLRDFRIDGRSLRADLHLLKTTPHRAYVLEIADSVPESLGLSISFSGEHETRGAEQFARCSEIYSADLVSEPAANPSGLFSNPVARSAPVRQQRFETLVALKTRELGSQAKAIAYCVKHYKDEHRTYAARVHAGEHITFECAPASVTPLENNQRFEDIVHRKSLSLGKAGAIRWAVSNHPEAHRHFLRRTYEGERIAL